MRRRSSGNLWFWLIFFLILGGGEFLPLMFILAGIWAITYALVQAANKSQNNTSSVNNRRTNRYGCIYNLVRSEDFFTRVPLVGWGYTKYGRNISLSDIGDMTARYRQLTGEDYIGFTRQGAVDNFLCAVYALAPNVTAYYRRRRQVGDRQLSLYEFMTAVADLLAQHMDEQAADIFFSAMVSDYADLLSFLSSGADLSDLIASATGTPKCSIADSHSPAAYMASLDAVI